MVESLQCPSCGKDMKRTRLVVIHPENKRLIFVCCEACARKMLVNFCTKDHSLNFSTLKVYYNRKDFKDLPLFKTIIKKPLNNKKHPSPTITKEEVENFKIDFGLNGDSIIKELIESGRKFFKK